MKTKENRGSLALRQLLLLTIITFSCAKSSFTCALTEEANALLVWKSSLQNPNNSLLSSWATTSGPMLPCTWFGVSCTRDGSINRLNLSSSSLQGTLYKFSFSSFPNLAYFELSFNSLSGTIPSEISYLSKLVYLDFSNNQFSGIIPPEIGLYTSLEALHLFKNQLNGSIPQEIGNLNHLSELALYGNNLQGTIPASFGNLTSLIYLYLYNNSISGPIPLELGNLSNLEELLLSQNFLTGSIPSNLGNLSKLTFLHLPENQLSGSIPAELSKLTSLQNLVLSMNKLFGFIPPSLGNLTSLSYLYLHTNNLSGPIPEELGKLNSLTDLELDQNQLNGSIPASFGNLIKLEILYLRDNKLSGPIPQELGNLMNVVEFGLDTNKFSGFLPEKICSSGKLQFLTVNNNELIGPIPRSLRNCSSLVRARFERNQFSGNISEIFGVYPHLRFINLNDNKFYGELSVWSNCKNLSTLQIARNNITGNIPAEFGTSTLLGVLDLSTNQLEGEIPNEFGQLSLLKLDLSGNQLSGALPPEIVSLTDLSYLDLSRNKLNGSIPGNAEVRSWQKLTYMDLSHNNFSSGIPVLIPALTQLNSLDLSYNSLTGGIPSKLPELVSLEILNLSYNKLSGSIPKSFDNMPGLLDIDISYNELWGPIPNNEAFMQASRGALQGNKGLCGGNTSTNGLKSCEIYYSSVKKNKKSLQRSIILAIVLSIMGVLSLVFIFTWLYIIHRRRKQSPKVENVEYEQSKNVFSASNFDGSAMYEEILKATNVFDTAYCIGKGGFATVYKAKLESHNIVVAVKKLHTLSSDEMAAGCSNGFLNEVRAQMEIRHRNILKLYGYCSHARHSFLIFEYMERGSLSMILSRDEEAKKLDWLKRITIVKGIAHALSYMHHGCSPSIVHRDISSKNILLKSNYEACLSDFGFAKLLNQESINWSDVAGTIGYIAPELTYTTRVTEKCDVYSFGVLVLKVIKGTHPGNLITSVSSSSAETIVLDDLLDPRLPDPSLEVREVIKSILVPTIPCLNENPQARPTMHMVSQLLSTAYLEE